LRELLRFGCGFAALGLRVAKGFGDLTADFIPWKLEIEETIDQLKVGQSVDPKKIDQILNGQVNY
jgi:hypothetical protein